MKTNQRKLLTVLMSISCGLLIKNILYEVLTWPDIHALVFGTFAGIYSYSKNRWFISPEWTEPDHSLSRKELLNFLDYFWGEILVQLAVSGAVLGGCWLLFLEQTGSSYGTFTSEEILAYAINFGALLLLHHEVRGSSTSGGCQ